MLSARTTESLVANLFLNYLKKIVLYISARSFMYVTLWVLESSFFTNLDICTCHNKKSLRRTSPDVLTNRSGSLDGLVYMHLSKTVSLISLNKKTYQSVSLCWTGFNCYDCWNFCCLRFDHVYSLQYLSLMIPI